MSGAQTHEPVCMGDMTLVKNNSIFKILRFFHLPQYSAGLVGVFFPLCLTPHIHHDGSGTSAG